MAVRRRDADYHTYGDYQNWSADYGNELVDGVAYVREPPSPSRIHQDIVGELHRQVANALVGETSRVYAAPFDVRLPKSTEEDDQVNTVVQPDVLIVCDPGKIDARGVRGAPDWVVEVLSPGTARYDQITKIPAYERAGVREVWLVHPTHRTVTIYRLEAGAYPSPIDLELKGQTPLTAVPGVVIDWERVLARISD